MNSQLPKPTSTELETYENPISRNKERMYSPFLGKWVKTFVGNLTHFGVVSEVNSRDGYVELKPSLLYGSGDSYVRAEVSDSPLRTPYAMIMGMQEISTEYVQEALADAQRKNKVVALEFMLRSSSVEHAMNANNSNNPNPANAEQTRAQEK